MPLLATVLYTGLRHVCGNGNDVSAYGNTSHVACKWLCFHKPSMLNIIRKRYFMGPKSSHGVTIN